MPVPDKTSARIAWIGTGVMGAAMAGHLRKAGHALTVFNRTREKAAALLDAGARWAETPGEAAREADAVFTIVGFPSDVREVYFGPDGILENARRGAVLCDMTTSEPSLAQEIAVEAERRGMAALDAPVSGGDVGAREARLSIMVGGSQEAFDRILPLLSLLGKQIVLQGPAGAGQHTKMCNQIAVAGTMMGVAECLLYAQRAGLDPERMLESVGSGAASSWLINNLSPRILKGDFDPGFYIRHFVKDLKIAVAEAEKNGAATPATRLALDLYQRAEQTGRGSLGTQALFLTVKEMAEK